MSNQSTSFGSKRLYVTSPQLSKLKLHCPNVELQHTLAFDPECLPSILLLHPYVEDKLQSPPFSACCRME